jgi:predicted dehydrogenase
MNRRDVLKFAALPAAKAARKSDRPACAVVGLGNRGRGMAEWQFAPFADVAAICDVDQRKTAAVAAAIQKRTGRKVDVYADYRRILDRKDIDAIGNATPPHWHAKLTIDACRAGKDVYTEKPLTYSVAEGRLLAAEAARTGRVVQVGTQQRSGIQFRIAAGLVRAGRIGRLKRIAVILPGGEFEHGGACVAEPVPPELDWDMWSGPAPLRDFCAARLRAGNWSEYGGGLVMDWGAHHMDIAHWAMGGAEVAPVAIEGWGYCPNLGKPGMPDQFRPFAARLEYPDGIEMWFYSNPPATVKEEHREALNRLYVNMPPDLRSFRVPDPDGGVLFEGAGGRIFVGRQTAQGEGIPELEQMPLAATAPIRWRACLYEHTRDFVDCIRTRRQPVSDPAGQHRTHLPCHLANIAMRLGRKLRWDGRPEEFTGDREANAMLRRARDRAPYTIES